MIDLDNTLADRQGAVVAWINEFVEEHALPMHAVDWFLATDRDGYAPRRQVVAALVTQFKLRSDVDELLAAYQRRVVELTSPCAGAIECLDQLRSLGARIAIVTNGSSGQQQSKIDALGFRSMVDAVCVSGEFGTAKPDREIFERAAELCGAELVGSWMVGDSPTHDIVGGQNVGAHTAWVHRDRSWAAEAPVPTLIVGSLTELVTAIRDGDSAVSSSGRERGRRGDQQGRERL